MKIVLLDKDPEYRRAFMVMIARLGNQVTLAASEQELAGALAQALPDVAVLSHSVRLESDAAAESIRLKADRPEIGVVLVANGSVPQGHVADAVLLKPFRLEQLDSAIRAARGASAKRQAALA